MNVTEWISIEDKEPDMGQVVLVFGPDENPITAYRVNDITHPKWVDYQDPNEDYLAGVTHWMPLPEPPSE